MSPLENRPEKNVVNISNKKAYYAFGGQPALVMDMPS